VTLGVARELLRERDELLTLQWSTTTFDLTHGLNHIRAIAAAWQPQVYNFSLMSGSLTPLHVRERASARWARRVAIVVLVVLAFGTAFALTPPRGPRSMRTFQPARLAGLEIRMWQAYYAKQRVRLFSLLVTMLHEQYHYSWAMATLEGFHLARAAATFGDLQGGYEVVLPDLEAAYAQARSWTEAAFDPRAVARAELMWWVDRRIPGRNSPEQIGKLIADEYALLYETTPENVADAAYLRAKAAKMRDDQAAHPDWDAIGRLLRASYEELLAALASANV
jgi:hypothetical protein